MIKKFTLPQREDGNFPTHAVVDITSGLDLVVSHLGGSEFEASLVARGTTRDDRNHSWLSGKTQFTAALPPISVQPQVVGTFVFERPAPTVTILRSPGVVGTAGDIIVIPHQQEEVEGATRKTGPEDPLKTCGCQTLPVDGSIGSAGPLPDAFCDEPLPEVEGVDGEAEIDNDAERERRYAQFINSRTRTAQGDIGGAEAQRRYHRKIIADRFGASDDMLDATALGDARLRALGFQPYANIFADLMNGPHAFTYTPPSQRAPLAAEMDRVGLLGSARQTGPQLRPLEPGRAAWASLDKLVSEAIAAGATSGNLRVTSGEYGASASWKEGVVLSAYMSKVGPDSTS